ncbi:MAG: long-chain fatty acid--CoA ligase [Actinomycetales bacterium]|nr:MAG: long-chain fatty acid--CoA ligase [Actinomycetales bacterium]
MSDWVTVRDLVTRTARFGDRVALRAEEHERTFADLTARAARLGGWLLSAGLEPGDRVAVMVEDGLRSVEPHLAAILAGLVVVPVNARFRSHELEHILTDCGARAVVHSAGVSGVVDDAPTAADLVRISTGGGAADDVDEAYEELVGAGPSPFPDVAVSPDDLVMIGYTSGTTGVPKGAMMSHAGAVAAVRANLVAFRVVPYGACAFSGSISFTALVWAFVMPHLAVGASLDLLQPRLTMDRWFDRMERHGSTFTFVPTPFMDEFARTARVRPRALVRLAGVCHSASPATQQQRAAMVEVLGGAYVESYGMTESLAAVAATTRLDADGSTGASVPHATIGRPLAPADVLVVGPDGAPLPPGEVGEIVIESPSLFVGYWGRPEATGRQLRDGRFLTGDLGHVDEEGFLYVDGRAADLIISGGMNVYPAEVERVLHEHPDVLEAAVVGVPHERWGETVCAVVVPRAGVSLSADDVVEHVAERLAGYKKPTRVVFLTELPRNANAKVVKTRLRASLLDPGAEEVLRFQ